MRQRQLPPLGSLRGFEAAARHLSFTVAASELNLTQGAISRQVKELETYLGRELFQRMTRRIALTPEGESFFKVVAEMLDGVEAAARTLVRRRSDAVLTVSAMPTLTALWLMPQLPTFASAHQDVEIKIVSSTEPANLLANEADVAIRVGRLPGRHYDKRWPRIGKTMVASWDGVQADELFPDRLVPVCHPDLVEARVSSAVELTRYPLIHLTTRRNAWPDWLKAHDVEWNGSGSADLRVSHFFMSLDAARQGKGVALVPDVILAQGQVAHGLVSPFRGDVPSAGEYYLLVHETRLDQPHVRQFREWCLAEARELRRRSEAGAIHGSTRDERP